MRPRTARPLLILAATLSILLVGAPSLSATEPEVRLLGSGGDVFQLRTGTLGELFGDTSTSSENPALALEIVRSEEIERLVVPGTEDADREVAASALFETESSTLYLAWVTRFSVLHTRITVRWLREGLWSPAIELTGSAFSEKTSPRIAFTRESFELVDEEGARSQHTRSIVHTLWAETSGLGERVAYTPLVFIDGEPADEIVELTLDPEALVADVLSGSDEDMPFDPTLASGASQRQLLATLSDHELISVLTLDPVPVELTRLGDEVRASIVPIGRLVCVAEDGPARLALAAREGVVSGGSGLFHPSVLQHVANAAEGVVVRSGSEACVGDLGALATSIYEEILQAGSDALTSGRVRVGSPVRASIVPIGRSVGGGRLFEHRIRIGRISRHRLPPVEAGRAHVLPSTDGRQLLVAWEQDDALSFRESTSNGEWSELSTLRIDTHLDLPSALELLERRISGR